jgi:hypothetical protein
MVLLGTYHFSPCNFQNECKLFTRGSFPVIKRPGRQPDYWYPFSTKVNISQSNFFTSPYPFWPGACQYSGVILLPLKANSHIPCRSHAASMPFPCHAVPLWV